MTSSSYSTRVLFFYCVSTTRGYAGLAWHLGPWGPGPRDGRLGIKVGWTQDEHVYIRFTPALCAGYVTASQPTWAPSHYAMLPPPPPVLYRITQDPLIRVRG